jgi:hypothetical protein
LILLGAVAAFFEKMDSKISVTEDGKSLKELAIILRKLPHLDDDNEVFARDIREIVNAQPIIPEKPIGK